MRKPFFRASHKTWYCKCPATGRFVRLDKDEQKAYEIWRDMLDASTKITPSASFARLAEQWLQDHYEDSRSFDAAARRIASFTAYVGIKKASSLTRQDMVKWLDQPKPGQKRKDKSTGKMIAGKRIKWSQRTKKVAFSDVKKVIGWAVSQSHLKQDPFGSLKIADGQPRSEVVTAEQLAALLGASDKWFRQYLIASKCGARPRQIREVTAANVLPDFSAWVFADHKTRAKTGKPLVVYLSPCLATLTKVLVSAYPSGPLFRNSRGTAWKKDTVVHKMKRLREDLGLPKSVINYAFRHTFATDALLAGASLQTVSELLGHKDARMVSRVYGHLDKHRDHLIEAARIVAAKQYNG